MWLAKSINKWVEGIAVRGAISQLSGLICEELLFTWLGKFYICQEKVREKSGNFKNLWLWQPWYPLGRHITVWFIQGGNPRDRFIVAVVFYILSWIISFFEWTPLSFQRTLNYKTQNHILKKTLFVSYRYVFLLILINVLQSEDKIWV